MKKFSRIFVLSLCAMLFAAPHAQAALTDKDVKQFVEAIPDVEGFSDELKKSGKDKELEAAATQNEGNGKGFKFYVNSVDQLKAKYPDEYKKLGGLLGKHGFSSPEQWASTGDAVMYSYMAVKIEKQNPDALKQLTDIPADKKKQMSPEQLQQLDRATAMMKMVQEAPKGDKKVVETHMAEIDQWLDRSMKEEQAEAAKEQGAAPAAAADKPAEKKAD